MRIHREFGVGRVINTLLGRVSFRIIFPYFKSQAYHMHLNILLSKFLKIIINISFIYLMMNLLLVKFRIN